METFSSHNAFDFFINTKSIFNKLLRELAVENFISREYKLLNKKAPFFGKGITNFLHVVDYLSKILVTYFSINLFENLDIDR